MPSTQTAHEIFDREFLGMRARLVDLGATLDRLDRADGSVADDPRLANIRRCLEILGGDTTDRAEQIQRVFSLPYEENWRE